MQIIIDKLKHKIEVIVDNPARIENKILNDIEYENISDFIKDLQRQKDIVADVYLNFKRVLISNVIFSESSDWLIANIVGAFSLTEPLFVDYITIKLHQLNKDIILASSSSKVNEYIEKCSQEVRFNFVIGSLVPCNERKIDLSPSSIKSSNNNYKPSQFSSLKSINDDISIEVE